MLTMKCFMRNWLLVSSAIFFLSQHALADDWRPGVPRTAYVNLFEWSWYSVAKECITELGPKGYAAVQVSPPQEHVTGAQWWVRYQPVSYKIFSRNGSRAQFAAMVKICKAVGVDVYVDAVINHMAGGTAGIGIGGSLYGNYNYPSVPYTIASFHQPTCVIKNSDYDNIRENVTQCDLPGLPDLDTGKLAVQNRIAAYMKDLLSLGVAGFRIDAAKHIRPEELAAIKALVPGDYFLTQEVIKDGSLYSSGDINRYPEIGTVNEFSYIYAMKNMFLNLFGYNLSRMPEAFTTWGLYPSETATVFVNNHDTERGFCDKFSLGAVCDAMNTFNGDQYYLANIFMLAYPYGYPQVMSGYNFADYDMGPPVNQPYKISELTPSNCNSDPMEVGKWNCVHRDNRVANMVGFRNYTADAPLLKWAAEGANRIQFQRGNKGFVAINNTDNHWDKTFNTGLPDATYCNVLISNFPETGICPDAARVMVVEGQATASVPPNAALALHFGAIKADLERSVPPFIFADSLNVARGQILVSKKTYFLSLNSALVSVGSGATLSVDGGAFTPGPVTIKPGQSIVLKTTAPVTDHTVKLVEVTVGRHHSVWKVATAGAICSDNYCPSIVPIDYAPSIITAGKPVTLYYLGALSNSPTLKLHWQNANGDDFTEVTMVQRADSFWSATITPASDTTTIRFFVTDDMNLDNNDGANWSLPVTPAVDTSVEITFKVNAVTVAGESVYIVGNRAEIGNWSTAADSFRQCTSTTPPQWICTIRFPASGIAIEYKYQKIGNGMLTWENGSNYNYLLPSADAEVDNGVFR